MLVFTNLLNWGGGLNQITILCRSRFPEGGIGAAVVELVKDQTIVGRMRVRKDDG